MSTSEIAKLESRWRENPQGLTFAPLAEAYRKMKEPQRALEILGEGIGLHPDYIPASIVLGRCHLDLGDDAAAEGAFARVLALDSENVIALKALAEITEKHLRFDEAENWLRQLLVIDRSNDEARAQLTRVEDSRRNTVGIVRDENGAALTDAAEDHTAEDDTGEMTAETSAELEAGALFATSAPAPVEAEDPGHDFEPVESGLETLPELDSPEFDSPEDFEPLADSSHIAFDTADPAAAAYGSLEGLDPREVGHPDVAAPMLDDLEPAVDMSESLVPVQKAEELELQSSGANEFQAPDAAADLAGSGALAEDDPSAELSLDEPASEEPADYEWTPMSADQEISADSWTEPAADSAWPEIEPASMEAELDAGLTPEAEPAPDLEPVALDAPPVRATADHAPILEAEPEPIVTESMAELYLGQGHAHEALAIYRELYLRSPDDHRLRDRVTALETAQAAADPGEPEQPDYSASAGGQSVAAMFQALLRARPAPATTWSPVAAPPERAAPSAGSSAPATSEGEPTRPADDRLSLSAVFGDDSSPVPPAVPAAQVPADGMSFDAFFDSAPPAEPAPRRAAARDDDDLDQFHAWLQNLKR